jgi:hypothetical protein
LENLARQGFNIVVDSFITTHDEFLAYKNKLGKYGAFFVYLYAAEEIIRHRRGGARR